MGCCSVHVAEETADFKVDPIVVTGVLDFVLSTIVREYSMKAPTSLDGRV